MKRITTDEEIEASGPFAFPGGYAVLYLGSEGATICFECAKKSLGGNDPTLTATVLDGEYESPELCDDCSLTIDLGAR